MEEKQEIRFVKRVELVILVITLIISGVLYAEAIKKDVLVQGVQVISNTKDIVELKSNDKDFLYMLHKIDNDNTEIMTLLKEHLKQCGEETEE